VVRNTRASRLIVSILQGESQPLSLRELHERAVRELPSTAYSTVYRVVERLQRDGKVNRVDWRERGSRFEWAERPHHHHIVCDDCGRSVDVDDRDLGFDERRILQRTGFQVRHHTIELEGTCGDCRRP
jgi:Fur family ferric uptake transcriptional regulator